MKPNQYHVFTIAVTGMLLIILGLILFGCTDNGVCLLDKCTNVLIEPVWID